MHPSSTALSDLVSSHRLFRSDDDGANRHICPQDPNSSEVIPVIGSLTFHTLAALISGAAAVFVVLLATVLILTHARHYTAPKEQKQIIRIICLVPFFSIVSLLAILAGEKGLYIEPAKSVGEALAITSFFLLCAEYAFLAPSGSQKMFGDCGGLRQSAAWLKRVWYLVSQFLPVSILLWIITAITFATGTYCKQSNKIYFAHIWLTVITFGTTFVALMAVIRFYQVMKAELRPQRALLQLSAFMGLVALTGLQSFITNILLSTNTFKPSKYMSYADINEGLPSLLVSCEMPIFAVFFFYAFGAGRYKARGVKQGTAKSRGCVQAKIDAMNVTDILSAFARGPIKLLRDHEQSGDSAQSGKCMGLVASPPSYDCAPITRPRRSLLPSPERFERRY